MIEPEITKDPIPQPLLPKNESKKRPEQQEEIIEIKASDNRILPVKPNVLFCFFSENKYIADISTIVAAKPI